ncbi:hypothetical protein OPT61_g9194 [Boeremia exigua]|uniref:Uncharacterized protein n=1 Tax=Boeremia exigua TaxID=749465 RepID=A0ACC2HVH8_9PLEO|nr:hypothetical protein OPT61_g9194 [Boeremia exigua]
MTWKAHLALVLALIGHVAATCSGLSDSCSSNPNPQYRSNGFNFHSETCNLKWKYGCVDRGRQKPPPFSLCTSGREAAGLLPVDAYTLAVQNNTYAPDSAQMTLHGLWPGSENGNGAKNQPYGCQNGEEFDEKILDTFGGLLSYFWPTDPKYQNTMQCFILSEWMKHGTCAVIPGKDGTAFRLSQEAYFRTAFVMANEFNANDVLRQQLQDLQPLISVRCVQCAYLATVGWTGTDVAGVPRMSSDCIDQCFECGNHWDTCIPAQLDSTVQLDPINAPLGVSSGSDSDVNLMEFAMPAFMDSKSKSPWEGTWRSFGAEQLGSGKFEFMQNFTDNVQVVTTDSPYPQTCAYEQTGLGELTLRCGGAKPHVEDCLVQRLPDIGGLDAAFLACNHSGQPAPASFYAAMDTPGCGNFLMFRDKVSAAGRSYFPDAAQRNASQPENGTKIESRALLGSWRSLEVSSNHQEGLAQWNFTADGQATLQWPNYPGRGVQRYSVSPTNTSSSSVLLAGANGTAATCRFEFQYQPVYSYAVLDCEAASQQDPLYMRMPHLKTARPGARLKTPAAGLPLKPSAS